MAATDAVSVAASTRQAEADQSAAPALEIVHPDRLTLDSRDARTRREQQCACVPPTVVARVGVGMMPVVSSERDRRGSVFIAEEDDVRPGRGELYLTGTFWASWQTPDRVREEAFGLSAEDAIAWGRARADRVFIRLGVGDYFWAGIGQAPPGAAPWPPPGLPELMRRRHPDFAYLDRAPHDPEIEWEVTLWVGPQPSADASTGAPVWAGIEPEVIAAIADRAGARWDSEARDELLADLDRAERTGKRRGRAAVGWMSYGRDAYRLRLSVFAPTEQLACDRAASRVELPAGLRVEEASAVPSRRSER
jgi:hypothetical protein